ncbi:MAG: ABC transporter permease [Deltaproteobacteria bacterium]|nr:ABC transporter permease [Deltaproteobacteria bacterium]
MSGARMTGLLGALLIAALVALSLAGDRVAGVRFDAQDAEHALEPPSRAHWLGTDALGRDLLARVSEGARVSLLVAIGATTLALLIGLGYGLLAGWVGGRVDGWLMRIVDVVYALPDVLVIVLLIEVLQGTLAAVPDIARRVAALVVALGFVGWVGIARLVRALVLQAREELWVEAARALGLRDRRILLRHVLPNVAGPILVAAAFQIPAAILAESTLSFIGLGIQPPFSSWGTLASDGFEAMRSYPHLILFPCLAILLALVGFHLLGEAMRAALDPRSRS